MLPPDQIDFSIHQNQPTFNINDLSEEIHHDRTELLSDVLNQKVIHHQNELLDQDIGGRYQRNQNQASFSCPRCQGRHFTRKGKRPRNYKCVLGKILTYIVQVLCSTCGHRFCPYKDQIGLSFEDRSSQGLKDRQVELTCNIPYQKASDYVDLCLDISLCPTTIRKEIDRQSELIRSQTITATGEIVFEDGTKVKAGDKERGLIVHLAITAVPGDSLLGRNSIDKRFLFLTDDSGEAVKARLKALGAKAIVHDGDMNLTGCAPYTQRCLWHLPHQLHHFLWEDGLNQQARKPYVSKLIHILFESESISDMQLGYRKLWSDEFQVNGFRHAQVHLQKAENELHIAYENEFPYSSTSPVEREMREINRRADVGVRWSVKGIVNLLRVKTFRRLHKHKKKKVTNN